MVVSVVVVELRRASASRESLNSTNVESSSSSSSDAADVKSGAASVSLTSEPTLTFKFDYRFVCD
jgi:hypothetical protein